MSNLFVSENGKDLCISCKIETEYSHDTSLDYREYYIEGAGQLCKSCYDNIINNLREVAKTLPDE